MKRIKVALIDGDSEFTAVLKEYLGQYGAERDVTFTIDSFCSAEKFLEGYRNGYDLVSLEIDLKGINGMKAAEKLRAKDARVAIMFITNKKQYALKGYNVGAINYLLKPLDKAALYGTLDRFCKGLNETDDDSIVIKSGSKIFKLNRDDIMYVDTLKHYIYVHTKKSILKFYGTLKEFANKVKGTDFIMISSSTIVNPKHIEKFDSLSVTIKNGDKVEISRRQRKEVREKMLNFYGK